jgi:predicted ATPase
MQLVVTTHSDLLIDALQEQPESVITVEAAPQGTQLNRLNAQELAKWLEKYSLGELWTRGEIGGVRW